MGQEGGGSRSTLGEEEEVGLAVGWREDNSTAILGSAQIQQNTQQLWWRNETENMCVS